MGDTFEDILARIAVSRQLIAAYAGMTAAILMSASEREEISSMLRGDRGGNHLTIRQCAELVDQIRAIGLQKNDEILLLDVVQEKLPRRAAGPAAPEASAAPAPPPLLAGTIPAGFKAQNFETIPHFLTAKV